MASNNGSNLNDSESAAEFVATVRNEHVAMKMFYNEHADASLRSKYGESYPSLWKDVLNWPGWKETRKAFLQHQQKQQSNTSGDVPRKRKSRWGSAADSGNGTKIPKNDVATTMALPPPTAVPLPDLSQVAARANENPQVQKLQAELREISQKLEHVDAIAAEVDALPKGHRDRSPSPPPIYGPDGKRQNTRAIRYREKFSRQRQDLLDQLLKFHNPNKTMMSNHPTVFFQNKRTVKVPIPIEDHPNYNFIGLIIGPRGKTQKELEAKTGCKIAIRGRGSVKTGARGRRDGRINPGDDDPLHVVITGDDPDSVTAAESMIRDMLIVIDDEKNVHKQQQLRELALLNGTLKESDDVFCGHCGDKGHRTFECPKRLSFAKNAVKCAICGDTSHPTSDCKKVMITAAAAASNAASNSAVDQDYQNFLAELEGKKNSNTEHDTDVGGPPAINLPPPPPPIQVASASQQSLPPPPVTTTSTVNLQPPSNMPPPLLDVHLPPLPTLVGLPPPPQTGVFNQQQLPPASYGHQYGTFPSQHLAPQQQQAHPQHVAVQPGQETAAWDPNAYFGTGSGIGGAGGFNWWEQ